MCKVLELSVSKTQLMELNLIQGCALAEPSGPWRLTFALGRLENLIFFSYKSYAGHPRFYSFGELGSLQFSFFGCNMIVEIAKAFSLISPVNNRLYFVTQKWNRKRANLIIDDRRDTQYTRSVVGTISGIFIGGSFVICTVIYSMIILHLQLYCLSNRPFSEITIG